MPVKAPITSETSERQSLIDAFIARLVPGRLHQVARFGLAGGASTLFYLVVATILVTFGHLQPVPASIAAYLLSLGVSYSLQSRFTFRQSGKSAAQVARFLVTALVGLALSYGLVYLASDVLHLWSVAGNVAVCILIPIANYFVFKLWVFSPKLHRRSPNLKVRTMSDNGSTGQRHSVTQQQVADDFDRIRDTYEDKINAAISFGGREHAFYIDIKRDHIVRLAAARFGDLTKLDVLDLGCGLGAYHPGLEGRFHQLHGIDVSTQSIELARQRHPFVRYESFDGGTLPYADGSFDVAFTVCVMHHVPPPQWEAFTAEMRRVLKPGGLALVFEHNPYNPATQYIVRTCDIDRDAVLLRPDQLRKLFVAAKFEDVHTRSVLSVPPVNGPLARLDQIFGHLPFGAQYYLSGSKPR